MSCVEVVLVTCESITVTLCEDNTQVSVGATPSTQVIVTEQVTTVTLQDQTVNVTFNQVVSHNVTINLIP